MGPVMTIEEIAELWRVSKMSVYRWVKDGDLPYYKVGRTIRVTCADHDEFAKKRKHGGEAA